MEDKDLITFCGAYCGQCSRFAGFTAFREAAALLAEIADSHGYQYWMPEAAKGFDYAGFRKGLEFFRAPKSSLICQRGCRNGDGRPDCPMRNCCRERQFDGCFDCGDFPCQKVKWDEGALKRARDYGKLGREEWLREQDRKAEQGFELHTGKYYLVRATEHPPGSLPVEVETGE
jgi:hypothetical protein